MSAQPLAEKRFSASHPGRDTVAAEPSVAISNAIVGLYKEAFGRGPTKARTAFVGPDVIMVLLEDALTVTERTLLALDEIDRLRDSRLVVQEALEERARSVVEGALGRHTLAFITGIDPRRGVAVNIFTLEPDANEDSRQDGAAFRAKTAR